MVWFIAWSMLKMHALTLFGIVVQMYAWILSTQTCIGMIAKGMDAYGVSLCSEHDERKEYAFKCTEYPCVT